MIGGDPGEVREHARRVRAWAERVDAVAAEVLQSSSVAWVSDAADRFRGELEARQREVTVIAERYRTTAAKPPSAVRSARLMMRWSPVRRRLPLRGPRLAP